MVMGYTGGEESKDGKNLTETMGKMSI